MVKSDVRKDYYADLGLAPNAESEDIKKQFRKLALKYHPDRNPGKELEFIAKFQAIQAAHEILSDPQQRLKYDTERLRAGYGKHYAASRPNTSRKAPAGGYTPTSSARPPPFSARPHSFQNGPSTGAQRYASYARAAPQQSWGKKDDGQTRADAYRAFQGMKNNSPNTSSWSNGQSGFPGGVPRPHATPNGQRTKSAYEYFKTSPKPGEGTGPFRSQTTKKKQGFAPGTAGGDEPMAANTSAYSSVPREDRSRPSNYFFGNSGPPPTAKRAETAYPSTPEVERARSQYANTGGEKTFFSSAWLGRSGSMYDSPGAQARTSRTNPPSPSPPETSRFRSASPNLKTNRNRTFSSSTSSDAEDDERNDGSPATKPKAVPKSRLRRHQKPSDPRDWNTGTGEHIFPTQTIFGPGPTTYYYPWGNRFDYWKPGTNEYVYRCANRDYFKGHDSDSAASPRNPFAGTFASANFQPQFHPYGRAFPPYQNHTAKSSSHGNLRNEFSPADWHDDTQEGWFGFFTPKPSEADTTRATPGSNNRGRTSARNGSVWSGQSGDPSSSQDTSRSESASQQRPTPFAGAKFSADDWVEQFRNMSWAAPKSEGTQPQTNGARTKSPKKQTRPVASKARSTPQPASVASEADEEANTTTENDGGNQSAKASDEGGEAMDLDDETPATQASAPAADKTPRPAKARQGPSKQRPTSKNGNQEKESEKSHFNLKNLGNMAPFTSTNSGGIEDLQDINATLPFESRAKVPKTTARDVRPRELACPNPPKRPRRPALVATGIRVQMALPRSAWERYAAEMNTYMREWNEFNRRMLRHFNARQDTNETGLAPGWISAVGDFTRLNINGQNDPGDTDDDSNTTNGDDNYDNDDDDVMVAGTARGGFSAYLRAIEEDVKVRKHWDVACELHRECILELGELRQWILSGGKLM